MSVITSKATMVSPQSRSHITTYNLMILYQTQHQDIREFFKSILTYWNRISNSFEKRFL